MGDFGWYAPQLFSGALLTRHSSVISYYNRLSIVRIFLFALLIFMIFALGYSNPGLLLICFGIISITYSLSSGMAGIAFMEIVGKTIPTEKRGTLFGSRMFFGGLMAAAAGPLVKRIIDSSEFPTNFGILYTISLALIIAGLASFAFAKEEAVPEPVNKKQKSIKQYMNDGFQILRNDINIKRLILARFLVNTYLLATPFYVIIAIRHLGITPAKAAGYISFEMAGFLGLNMIWGWMSNKISNKALLKAATICGMIAPILALVSYYTQPGYIVYGLVFFFSGAGKSGGNMGFINYILEIAQPEKRPLTIGVFHTFIAPTALISAFGGIIIELTNIPVLLVITFISMFISLFYIYHLKEPARSSGNGA